jgi:hypothetical protein
MVMTKVMGRSLVTELLYLASPFEMQIISQLDYLRGGWDLFSTLLKIYPRILLILPFRIWPTVKDEGPGALSLPIDLWEVEMSAEVTSAPTEDLRSCAFGSG